MKLFEVTLTEPPKESLKQSWYAGFVLSLSQLLTTANTVAWRGLLYHSEIPYEHLFPTFFILVTTGESHCRSRKHGFRLIKGHRCYEINYYSPEKG